jgi:uncharacterized BrkB/YihY/UPF0761 family membrane protein
MNKRIKSLGITFASFAAVVATVTATPAWDTFLQWVTGKAEVSWGIPVAIIGLVTAVIDTVWRYLLNKHTLKTSYARTGSALADKLY